MKKIIIVFLLSLTLSSMSQTAVNFTCNDCSSVMYDLFTELDSGKIVVICWVMPCGSCVSASTIAYNVVQSYQSTYPEKVFFYLTDDFANTNCADLNTWANSINITESSFSRRFSNTAISMSDYGTFGMPKIVVLGGKSHTVFYNTNDVIDQTAFTNAIDSAISVTGIREDNPSGERNKFLVYPSPSYKYIEVVADASINKINAVKIINSKGICVLKLSDTEIKSDNKLTIDISELAGGLYFINLSVENKEYSSRFLIIK